MELTVAMMKQQNEGAIEMWKRDVPSELAYKKLELCLILKATLNQLEDDMVLTNDQLSDINRITNACTLEEALKIGMNLTL